MVSFESEGGNSNGGKVLGIFKFVLTKDFLVSFCGGGGFDGNTFLKMPIGTGGVLPAVDDLDGFIGTFLVDVLVLQVVLVV